MRKSRGIQVDSKYKIMIIDDEIGIIESVSAMLMRNGYASKGYTNPIEGIRALESEPYDLLILDYFMVPLHGDEVVERIRETDKELYILLLTGHKDLAPPIETIKSLDIQAYCEKSDRLDQLQLLVESAIKSIMQVHVISGYRDGLNSILNAAPQIFKLQPIADLAKEAVAFLVDVLGYENAFIALDLDEGDYAFSGSGTYKSIGRYNHLPSAERNIVTTVKTTAKPVQAPEGTAFAISDGQNTVVGAAYISQNAEANTDINIQLMELFFSQVYSAYSNAQLHTLVTQKSDELHDAYGQLTARYMDTVEALRLAVDAKDEYTRGHSDRVAFYASRIGIELGLSIDELEQIYVAGIFHDIGKIGTADDLLLKSDHLTDEEFDKIRQHVVVGANILSAVSMFKSLAPIVRHHHERVDGKGYPDRLAGEEIELAARILAVADAFDAMTSDRYYRAQLSLDETILELKNGRNTQFDATVVDVFVSILIRDKLLDMARMLNSKQ